MMTLVMGPLVVAGICLVSHFKKVGLVFLAPTSTSLKNSTTTPYPVPRTPYTVSHQPRQINASLAFARHDLQYRSTILRPDTKMLTGPTQHLQVHLPSPTTVSLTVTTRRQYTSKLQLRLLTLLQHAFRVVLVYHVLLVAVAKGQDNLVSRPPADGDGDGRGAFDVYADFCLRASLGGSVARLVAQAVGWWVLAPLAMAVVYLCLRRGYVGECCPPLMMGMDSRIW